MSTEYKPAPDSVKGYAEKLERDAQSGGYHLNPDKQFTMDLAEGLMVNMRRYGYESCPCRLAAGVKEDDLDIVCPCDYRDADLEEYGTCYCNLYVSRDVLDGKKQAGPIPERRPPKPERDAMKAEHGATGGQSAGDLPLPVWRCRVCGYLCARDAPPETCPICKAKKERFEQFM